MALGPWNTPPNFIAAMTGGASAGLQARGHDLAQRGQDIASSEAADRLSLAYQQLAAEEQTRSEAARQRLDIANAANAIKAQQIDMMDQWHKAQVAEELSKSRIPRIHFGPDGEVVSEDPVNGTLTQVREPRSKPTRLPNLSVPLDPNNPFGPKISGPSNDPEVIAARDAALKASADALKPKDTGPSLLDRFKGLFSSPSPLGGPGGGTVPRGTEPTPDATPFGTIPTAPPSSGFFGTPGAAPIAASPPAAAAASPYKEGALVRNKKNGKLYRITNGMPVQEESSPSSDNEVDDNEE